MELYTHKNAETSEERHDDALRSIKAGVVLINDIMKSVLGPNGALKIIQGKDTAVTNDGAYVMKNLLVDSPSARIIANSSIKQDLEEGDGTTSIAVLTSLLLMEAYRLSLPPIKIIRGFSMALSRCLEALNKRKISATGEDIKNIVRTTLNSKVLSESLDHFVRICISAAEKVDDISLIEVIKLEGDLGESMLVEGFVLNKAEKINIDSPRILVANTSMDYDKIKVMSSKINVSSVQELVELERAEKNRMVQKVDSICSVPFDLFVNRQIIYDFPQQLLRSKGVSVIEQADFAGVERLNKILGGNVVSVFEGLSESDLGSCGKVSNITVKGQTMVLFEGVKRGAATIILFGSSKEMLEEAERSIHDALCVLKRIKEDPFYVYGGGCIEMALSMELSKLALETKTREAEGIECFARALQQIPKILAENAGFDGDEAKTLLRNDHNYRRATYGINIENGKTCCMREKGVVEGLEMKSRAIVAACETAQSILKCDGIIKCKPRERTRH